MKRIAAVIFLSLYILAATEFGQLLKVPVLLEHFSEHKKDNGHISFLNFIYMHYAGTDYTDTDNDRDMQLPFKSHDGYEILDVPLVLSNSENVIIEKSPAGISYRINYEELNLSSSYLSSIWQPPKMS